MWSIVGLALGEVGCSREHNTCTGNIIVYRAHHRVPDTSSCTGHTIVYRTNHSVSGTSSCIGHTIVYRVHHRVPTTSSWTTHTKHHVPGTPLRPGLQVCNGYTHVYLAQCGMLDLGTRFLCTWHTVYTMAFWSHFLCTSHYCSEQWSCALYYWCTMIFTHTNVICIQQGCCIQHVRTYLDLLHFEKHKCTAPII